MSTATLQDHLDTAAQRLKTSDFAGAQGPIQTALTLAEQAGDRVALARAKKLQADLARYQGNSHEANRLYGELLKESAELGDKALLADTQLALARLKMPLGEQDNAWMLYESAGELYAALGDHGGEGQ
ncbi:MAG TPA: hypothetical protein VEI97_05915, partial [bacterium]|nr:hypothetical protein [bacterium]